MKFIKHFSLLFLSLLFAVQAVAQTNNSNLPTSLGTFNVFRNSDLPVTLVMPQGYDVVNPVVELWNNGVKLSDTTAVVTSGDTLRFTIKRQQLAPLIRNPYLFLKLGGSYVLGAILNPTIGVGTPTTLTRNIALPSNETIRVSIIGEAFEVIQASARAKDYRDSTKKYRDDAIAGVASRVKSGTIAQLKTNTEPLTSYEVTEPGKAGIFYYDPADTSTPGDDALTVVVGTKRFKRLFFSEIMPEWFGVVGDGLTDDRANMQRAFDAAANLVGVGSRNFVSVRANKRYLIMPPSGGGTALNLRSNLSGGGQFWTRNGASINIGRANVTVSDIRINGNIQGVNTPSGGGLRTQGAANITINNVKIDSVIQQAIWIDGSVNPKITNNTLNYTVSATNGVNFGDAIYCAGCINGIISNNIISNFQRIGIVGERSGAGVRSLNLTITNNIVKNAIETTDHTIYTNGGIWVERVDGALIANNVVENTFDRGIVMNRNNVGVSDVTKYHYTVTGNQILNAKFGVVILAPSGQIVDITGGIIADCETGIDVTYASEANITGVTFTRRNQPLTYFRHLVNYVPNITSALKSNLLINGCINAINSTTFLPVGIPDVFDNTGDITISNCTGNWALVLNIRKLQGNVKYVNTLYDASFVTSANTAIAHARKLEFINCDVIIPSATNMALSADEFNMVGGRLYGASLTSPVLSRLTMAANGPLSFRMTNVEVNYVHFTGPTRTGVSISLRGCSFDNYSTSGIFQVASATLARLSVRNCDFSESMNTVTPFQISGGVTDSRIGDNLYFSPLIATGFIPNKASVSYLRSTTANRPTVTQAGINHFNTDLSVMGHWTGSAWFYPAQAITNSATTAPTKATLNSTYGNYGANTTVTYPLADTGYDYRKLTETNSGDWVETNWATGLRRLIP